IEALDVRLQVEDGWELFGPELVAEWPVQTAEWYLPRRIRSMADSAEAHRRRDAMLAEAEVVCVTFPFPTRLVARPPRLRFVHPIPAGGSSLSRGDLGRSGVAVTSGRGAGNTLPIAEWALAAALALLKDLPRAYAQRPSGRLERAAFRGRQVSGKTIGIV